MTVKNSFKVAIGGYVNYDQQTEHSIPLFNQILATFGNEPNLSVLDIGCGYGTHLALAADRGWKCFGVEVSSHARTVANERHGAKHFVVEDIAHLIPHEFDLVVLFDVLEHLKDPYELFYALFCKP
jgi:2-polyprenyl-3-methyl-5-hydroxy-6-metoxy-1,4-benzoquinol methylase